MQVTGVPSAVVSRTGNLSVPRPPTCETHALFTLSAKAQLVPSPAYVPDPSQRDGSESTRCDRANRLANDQEWLVEDADPDRTKAKGRGYLRAERRLE